MLLYCQIERTMHYCLVIQNKHCDWLIEMSVFGVKIRNHQILLFLFY